MNKIGQHVTIDPAAELGAGVTIGNNVTIYAGVKIGDGCTIFDGAVLGRPPMATGTITRRVAVGDPLIIGSHSLVGANAVLYSGSTIGSHVLIGDLATMREGCVIAEQAVIGRGVLIMYDTTVGERSRVIDGAILTGRMHIEADVFIGPGVNTINDNQVYLKRFGLAPFSVQGPIVRRFAVLGSGCNLAANVEIGMGAIVAPNAMVTRSVAEWTIVAGVPARLIRPVPSSEREQILRHFELPTEHSGKAA